MTRKNKFVLFACTSMILVSCTNQPGQNGSNSFLNTGSLIGGLGGAGAGALLGGKNPLVATLVGAGVGSVLGTIVQNLTQHQQEERQRALQEVSTMPAGSSTSWQSAASPQRSGSSPQAYSTQSTRPNVTKARYVNKGIARNDKGQTCHKVQETIELPDGKTGTSEELVCPT